MEEKNKKGYVKIDFDLTNKLDRAIYEFFQKMYFGYKKKFVVACTRQYMNHNSDQMKELLDDLELNMSQIGLNLKEIPDVHKKLHHHTTEEINKHHHLSQIDEKGSIKKQSSSKLFKKT